MEWTDGWTNGMGGYMGCLLMGTEIVSSNAMSNLGSGPDGGPYESANLEGHQGIYM